MGGKTRGWKEIKEAFTTRLAKGSILVFDKWQATIAAAKRVGYKRCPPVNHSLCFRDRDSGFHSNDIESENNKIKQWLRARYGALKLGRTKNLDCDTILDLSEYVYRANIGDVIKDFLRAMAEYEHEDAKEELNARAAATTGDELDSASESD